MQTLEEIVSDLGLEGKHHVVRNPSSSIQMMHDLAHRVVKKQKEKSDVSNKTRVEPNKD